MEMENVSNESPLFELQIDETAKNHIGGMATWATSLAIISLVSAVISTISTFMPKEELTYTTEGYQVGRTSPNPISGIISLAISFLLSYFLYMFGKNAKKGISGMDQGELNEGFRNLKSYFKAVGILIIIALVFISLGVLIIFASA